MNTSARDIIVVDDNPVLRSVISEILRECHWQVRSAADGFAALKEIRARAPDVLLSDLNMSGMSGFELLSVVRRRFPLIAVIAMSGAFADQDLPFGVAADAFYPKGVRGVEWLLHLVSSIRAQPRRCAAPIWIPQIAANAESPQALMASCPECLRPFSFCPQRSDGVQQEAHCSHCDQRTQLALVGSPGRSDGTLLSPSEGASCDCKSLPVTPRPLPGNL